MVQEPTLASELRAAAAATSLAKTLPERPLCDACLGRLFAKVGIGHPNPERGRLLRNEMSVDPPAQCWICRGLLDDIPKWTDLVKDALAEWEFATFLIGSRFDDAVLAREEEIWAAAGVATQEPIKAEVNREVGKRLEATLAREVDFDAPEVVAIIETAYDHVEIQAAPLFLRGRYRKLVRGLPQTRWPCRRCRGAGCDRCGGTGKMYAESVQEIVAAPVMARTRGTDHAFHGMGREDVDAKMLGNGRPFVLEIAEPRVRSLDLDAVAREVNASGTVEVTPLEPATRVDIQRYKAARPAKTYSIRARLDPPVGERKLKEAVAAFEGATVRQRTPTRVAHRRADKTRVRTVRAARVAAVDGPRVTLDITADAGTYIKELLNGDDGRTRPSLAEALGVGVAVDALDVIQIHDGGE